LIDNLDAYYDVGIKRRNIERCEAVGGDQEQFIEGSITDPETVTSAFGLRNR